MQQTFMRLCTRALLVTCFLFAYQTAGAQSKNDPRDRPGGKGRGAVRTNMPVSGKNAEFPAKFLTAGEVGMDVSLTGEIDVKITVVGLNAQNEVKPIPDETKSVIRVHFAHGVEQWKKAPANVCGRSITIQPTVTFDFPANFQTPQANQNILYIYLNTVTLPMGTGMGIDKHRFAAYAPDLYSPDGVARFAKLRGTGKLPPFRIFFVDPWIMYNKNYQFQNNKIVTGSKVLENLAAHEFGHAMGLYETYLEAGEKVVSTMPSPTPTPIPTPLPSEDGTAIRVTAPVTKEDPPGIMSALQPVSDHDFKPEYVAEIMSRVFECRVYVTASIVKTSVWPPVATIYQWDFLGSLSTKYEGAFTSQWAYFNGLSNTRNYCTVPNREGETYFRNIPYKTYQPCTAIPELNNGDEIDFNLAEYTTTDGYLWEEFIVPPVSFDSDFSVGAGDCKSPVSVSNSDTPGTLPVIEPVFSLGTDGTKSWILDVKLSVRGGAKAVDPDPDRGPECGKTFSFTGRPVQMSEKSALGPIVVTSELTSDGVDIGKYTIEVKMKLAAKSAGSRVKK